MPSTKFDSKLDDSGKFDRKGNLVKKPICVINYNQCMGSIDKTDMLLSSVECVRKTSKWYKKIFFYLIDLSILNTFSAFKTVTGQNMPVANFQLEVIRQLLEKYGGNTYSNPQRKTMYKRSIISIISSAFSNRCKKIRVRKSTKEKIHSLYQKQQKKGYNVYVSRMLCRSVCYTMIRHLPH